MPYAVSKGNSIQFVAGDQRLAFAVVFDSDVSAYTFGLFFSSPPDAGEARTLLGGYDSAS